MGQERKIVMNIIKMGGEGGGERESEGRDRESERERGKR